MSDTGPPFNLPFPLGTDLVIDGAQAIEDLATAVAGSIDVAQVVRTLTTTATSVPTSLTDQLTVTITPKSATSTVLVVAEFSFVLENGAGGIVSATYQVTDNANNVLEVGEQTFMAGVSGGSNFGFTSRLTVSGIDSPASASPQTYKFRARTNTATSHFMASVSLIAYELVA